MTGITSEKREKITRLMDNSWKTAIFTHIPVKGNSFSY
jgi:hypothetical protein